MPLRDEVDERAADVAQADEGDAAYDGLAGDGVHPAIMPPSRCDRRAAGIYRRPGAPDMVRESVCSKAAMVRNESRRPA